MCAMVVIAGKLGCHCEEGEARCGNLLYAPRLAIAGQLMCHCEEGEARRGNLLYKRPSGTVHSALSEGAGSEAA